MKFKQLVALLVAAGLVAWALRGADDSARMEASGTNAPLAARTAPGAGAAAPGGERGPVASSAAQRLVPPSGTPAAHHPGTGGYATLVMPPANTPLKEVLVSLKAAADAGNAPAGCRVGSELSRCAEARALMRVVDKERSAAKKLASDAERAKLGAELTRMTATYGPMAARCEGVSEEDVNSAWRYLLNAARNGSATAATRLLIQPGLAYSSPLEAAEGWMAYRENAHQLLWQGIQAGDAQALFQGWFLYATGLTTGGTGFPTDSYLALAYATAVAPLLDAENRAMVVRSMAALRETIPPEQAMRAVAEGDQLRVKYFTGALPLTEKVDDPAEVDACAR